MKYSIYEMVANEIDSRKLHGFEASAENTGGGIVCVILKPTDRVSKELARNLAGSKGAEFTFTFGTANEVWGADISLGDDDWPQGGVTLEASVPSDSEDVGRIAESITDAARNFIEGAFVGAERIHQRLKTAISRLQIDVDGMLQ